MPRSSPTITLASPTPRVLWKCSAIAHRGEARADRLDQPRDRRRRRHAGRVAEREPVDAELRIGVDDRAAPRRPARRPRTGSRTRTRPRRAAASVPRAIAAISATLASDPAIGALRFAWLCVSLADTKHTISSTPAPSARSAPRALGTSAARCASARRAHAREHLVRVGELRHRARADERRRLDVPHAGGDQRVDDLGLDGGRDEHGLGLEAVARADLGDGDARARVSGLA